MDKFEYKVRADEIKELIAKGMYVQAAEIADSIDWRRVKSVMMLCTISDLYKINRRYEDAKNMLLLAYERRPGGKTICYSLCELCIKTEEFVQAINYYKEFVQVAPKDPGRYILQYKLYEAQDVSLEERINVLEELKARDYREKWAYELAYLYHRVGLATRCVEECDELIVWFGEGKYVLKAMELKMLHEPLTPAQQAKYDHRFDGESAGQETGEQENAATETTEEARRGKEQDTDATAADEIQVKPVNVGEYDTINLQAELAAGLKEVLSDEQKTQSDAITRAILAPMMDSDTESLDMPEIDEVDESDLEPEQGEIENSEVFFGATGEVAVLEEEKTPVPEGMEELLVADEAEEEQAVGDVYAETVLEEMRLENEATSKEQVLTAEPPKEIADVLSQESDGQIRLVIPEKETIEKQITGQMSIEDILLEWERMKQENEEKRKETVRQHVLEQTGTMFTEFEAAVRDGLLEQLERGKSIDSVVEAEETEAEAEDAAAEEAAEETEAEAEDAVAEETIEETVEQSAEDPEDYGEVEEIEEIEEPEETEESKEEPAPVQREASKIRSLTQEEKELFEPFIQSRAGREKLIKALDNISLAAYTGNIVITGEEGMDTLTLAKNLCRELQMTDSNFSGKVAKITGTGINGKDFADILSRLNGGALIIQHAVGMTADTAESLHKALQQENLGIVVVLEGTRKDINRLFTSCPQLQECFTARVDLESMSNDSLVNFGKQYAREKEYSIDELGMLALHGRIEELQTISHAVTTSEVTDIVDQAIEHANRKTLGHFFDILFAKRYDEEDMIILTEKDFV